VGRKPTQSIAPQCCDVWRPPFKDTVGGEWSVRGDPS
jgi:hypothetical protein